MRSIDGENGNVEHGSTPLFAVRQFEQNRQASHGFGRVCYIRLSAGQRKPSDNRHAAGKENQSLGKRLSQAVALEVTGYTDPLGVVTAKSGMHSVDAFKRINDRRWRERVWCEPAARIQKQTRNHRKQRAGCGEPPK